MYKGIEIISYDQIDSCDFHEMKWNKVEGSNYMSEIRIFIGKYFEISTVMEFDIITLLSLILENVHDHGSGSCALFVGNANNEKVIEVYEENGGFDLACLPNGVGGCGFRGIHRSKAQISHSPDGKKTYILVPNRSV